MLRLHLLYLNLCPLVLSLDSTEKDQALSSLYPVNQRFIGTYKIPLNLASMTPSATPPSSVSFANLVGYPDECR